MTNRYENGGLLPEVVEAGRKTLSRSEVEEVLKAGGEFEEISLLDQDLSGLKLDGKSFSRSDVRGLKLCRETEDGGYEMAEIRNTDWTDADIADLSSPAVFCGVEAEGSTFGFTEDLLERMERLDREKKEPTWNDCGGYHNFNGNGGGFQNTKWLNIDFGGFSGHEAVFSGADFTNAIFDGCSLSGMDLSEAVLTGVKIVNFFEIVNLKISERYAEDVANGLQLPRAEQHAEFVELVKKVGAKQALADYLSVWTVPVPAGVN